MSSSYSDKNFSLDVEQEKIIKLNENILITGGAGTGKTTALVKKIEYLIEKCGVQKNQICVLTYSHKSQEEILSELNSHIDPNNSEDSIWVSTIDKLAREVFEKTHGSLVTSNDMIYKVASDYLYENYDIICCNKTFSNLMNLEDEEAIKYEEEGGFKKFLDTQNYLSRKIITIKGEKVKSRAERLIADFLFLNGINYTYEKPLWVEKRILQPDFTIEANGNEFIFEYFGVENSDEYDQITEEKKEAYSTLNSKKFICLEHTRTESLQNELIDLLTENGITSKDISISSEVRKRKALLPLTKLAVDCLLDYISMYTDDGKIRELELGSEDDNKEFVSLLRQIYHKYQMIKSELSFNNKMQFSDLNDVIKDAKRLLDIDKFKDMYVDKFKFRWLFVDEFQEVNNLRLEFIKQIIKLNNPHIILSKDNLQDTLVSLQRSQDIEDEIIQKIDESNRFVFNNHHRCRNEVYSVARSYIGDNSEYDINGEISIFICKYNNENLHERLQKVLKKEYSESQKEKFSAEVVGIEERDLGGLDVMKLSSLVKNVVVTCCEINKIKGTSCDTLCLMDSDINKHVEEKQYHNIILPITDKDVRRRMRRLIYVALTRSRKNVYIFLEEGTDSELVDELVKYKNVVSMYDFSERNKVDTKGLSEKEIEAQANDDSIWVETEEARAFELYKEIIEAYKSFQICSKYRLGQWKLASFLKGDSNMFSDKENHNLIEKNKFFGHLSDYEYKTIKQQIEDMLYEGYFKIVKKEKGDYEVYKLIEIDEKRCQELEEKCLLFRELKIKRREIILRSGWDKILGMWDNQLLDIVEYRPKTMEEFCTKVRAITYSHNNYGEEFFNALENFRKTRERKNLKK